LNKIIKFAIAWAASFLALFAIASSSMFYKYMDGTNERSALFRPKWFRGHCIREWYNRPSQILIADSLAKICLTSATAKVFFKVLTTTVCEYIGKSFEKIHRDTLVVIGLIPLHQVGWWCRNTRSSNLNLQVELTYIGNLMHFEICIDMLLILFLIDWNVYLTNNN
jgi:hypothetical protein